MNAEYHQQGVADAALARAELYDTLGQLTHQLNYARRIDEAIDDAKRRVIETKRTNPLTSPRPSLAWLRLWGWECGASSAQCRSAYSSE